MYLYKNKVIFRRSMTLFIQGLAIPLDQKNANGWGVPAAEADNVINSLKASQLRVCPGEAHSCDMTMDPYGRIGRIVDAWKEPDGIHAKAEVTDSVAVRKLKEGTWNDLKWSTFADSKTNPKLNDGWAGGVTVKSMTLVKNPAWSQAQYQVSASVEDDSTTKLRTFSDFRLIASQEGDHTTIEEELKAAQTKVADLQKELDASKQAASVSASTITELNSKVTTLTASIAEKDKSLNVAVNDVTDAQTKVAELTASVDKLSNELKDKTTLVAGLEIKLAGSIPMEQFDEKLAAAMEKHDAEKEAKAILAASREKFIAARIDAYGIETKPDEFTALSASDFDKLAEDMGKTKLAAGGQGSGPQIKYPVSPKAMEYDFATGAYDGKTGKWIK